MLAQKWFREYYSKTAKIELHMWYAIRFVGSDRCKMTSFLQPDFSLSPWVHSSSCPTTSHAHSLPNGTPLGEGQPVINPFGARKELFTSLQEAVPMPPPPVSSYMIMGCLLQCLKKTSKLNARLVLFYIFLYFNSHFLVHTQPRSNRLPLPPLPLLRT